MKIAHVDTERGWRGGQQQVLSLVEGLAARGWEGLGAVRAGADLEKRLRGRVPLLSFRPAFEWDPLAATRLRCRIKRERVDVVHAHTAHAVALAAAATLGTRIPFVATRRVDFPIGRNPLSRWKYGRAACVIAISDGVRNVLLADGIPEDRIRLVPSGVDFSRFDDLQPLKRRDIGVPDDAVLVGQVAALAPHKDQSTFLRAIAQLRQRQPKLRAVIVGEGLLRRGLEQEAARLKIDDIVTFLGHRSDALSCLRCFDVFCLSSWGEGLGTSIIDAMALRVPVAATQAGGIPDLVEDGVTGFLAPPRDSAALADAIERSLSISDREAFLARARERAERFSIDRTVSGMERVYESAVKLAAASR